MSTENENEPERRDDGESGADAADAAGTVCPTCTGSGRQASGADCPNCDGTGLLGDEDPPAPTRNAPALELRKRKAKFLKGTIEHRDFEIGGLECRELDDGTIRMSGYGSVTEHPYEVAGWTETIKRGAFKRTLSESPDVVLLYGHEGMPLARTKAGSLALEENARGLHWTADLDAEDPESRVLARKVERGLIDQCSFAFLVTDQAWSDDYTERSIKSVSIHRGDVSLVAMGANEATSVGLGSAIRSADGQFELRAGKTLSASTTDVLTKVLNLASSADDDLDELQPLLADLMGVKNPDDDDADDADDAAESTEPSEDDTQRAADSQGTERSASSTPAAASTTPIEPPVVGDAADVTSPTPIVLIPDFTTQARQQLDLLLVTRRKR